MSDKTPLYVWVGGSFGAEDIGGALVTVEGEVLTTHVSSSIEFLKADLTTSFGSRKAELDARFGIDGWEIAEVFNRGEVPDWLREANNTWAAREQEQSTK